MFDYLQKKVHSDRVKLINACQADSKAIMQSSMDSPTRSSTPPTTGPSTPRTPSPSSPLNRLRFHSVVRVVLIPTKDEYVELELDKLLWYSEEDCRRFKTEGIEEVEAYILKKRDEGTNLSPQQALKTIYQDDELCDLYTRP